MGASKVDTLIMVVDARERRDTIRVEEKRNESAYMIVCVKYADALDNWKHR